MSGRSWNKINSIRQQVSTYLIMQRAYHHFAPVSAYLSTCLSGPHACSDCPSRVFVALFIYVSTSNCPYANPSVSAPLYVFSHAYEQIAILSARLSFRLFAGLSVCTPVCHCGPRPISRIRERVSQPSHHDMSFEVWEEQSIGNEAPVEWGYAKTPIGWWIGIDIGWIPALLVNH